MVVLFFFSFVIYLLHIDFTYPSIDVYVYVCICMYVYIWSLNL